MIKCKLSSLHITAKYPTPPNSGKREMYSRSLEPIHPSNMQKPRTISYEFVLLLISFINVLSSWHCPAAISRHHHTSRHPHITHHPTLGTHQKINININNNKKRNCKSPSPNQNQNPPPRFAASHAHPRDPILQNPFPPVIFIPIHISHSLVATGHIGTSPNHVPPCA